LAKFANKISGPKKQKSFGVGIFAGAKSYSKIRK